jgi:hypothetical protein
MGGMHRSANDRDDSPVYTKFFPGLVDEVRDKR